MTVTNAQSGTNVHEIADGIYRINTPVAIPGDRRVLVQPVPHRRRRAAAVPHRAARMFPLVREAVASVMPVERLRHVAFSHVEADECGSLNEWLAAAPQSAPLCGQVAAMVSIGDLADRPPRALADGEAAVARHATPCAGSTRRTCRTRWECGLPDGGEARARCSAATCSRSPARENPPLTEGDILGPSEAFRHAARLLLAHEARAAMIEQLAATQPDDARVHARQRMARRRGAAAASAWATRWQPEAGRPAMPARQGDTLLRP